METMSLAANQHTIVRPFANELDKKNLPAPFAPSKSKEKMEGKEKEGRSIPHPCPPFALRFDLLVRFR